MAAKVNLTSLERIEQISKLIVREYFIKKGWIPQGTRLSKDVSIKIWKYYPEILDYKGISSQKEYGKSIKVFLNKLQQ